MELVKRKGDCCGCRTCEQVCPQRAIHMEEDDCGFWYPRIDAEKCVDCGLCVEKCAFQSGYKKRKTFDPYYGYGVRHKKEEVYMNSRSGGAFTALSDYVLGQSGVIYGVGFDPEKGSYYVRHISATTKEQRDQMRGSKYVQSDLDHVFSELKKKLDKGQTVLFSGTGCQVGALYAFLPREYENLYTLDIVCHGVASPRLWTDFLHMREEEKGGKVERADFRNKKKCGWKAHKETVVIGGKPYTSRIYAKLFAGCIIRESCFNCAYANKDRTGDITLADFWGHEKAMPGIWDDDKGISLVLVNNPQGMKLWNAAKEDVDFVDVTGYPFRHSRMKTPLKRPESYEEFWEDYKKEGFAHCAEKYAGYKMKKSCPPKETTQAGYLPEKKRGSILVRLLRKLSGKGKQDSP